MSSSLTPQQLRSALAQFQGSEQWFRHSFNPKVTYTEGVQFLAEQAEAYWLIDAIASYYGTPQMQQAMKADPRLESLQFWALRVPQEGPAYLSMHADSGEPAAICQTIPFTDFPLDEIHVWVGFSGTYWTLYLPSEH